MSNTVITLHSLEIGNAPSSVAEAVGSRLPPQVGAACRFPPEGVDVREGSRCGRQLLTELLVHQFQVAAVLPRLPQRPLDLLHPVPELPVPLLERGHLLLQFLDMVLLLKQGLLHRGAHELGR